MAEHVPVAGMGNVDGAVARDEACSAYVAGKFANETGSSFCWNFVSSKDVNGSAACGLGP